MNRSFTAKQLPLLTKRNYVLYDGAENRHEREVIEIIVSEIIFFLNDTPSPFCIGLPVKSQAALLSPPYSFQYG